MTRLVLRGMLERKLRTALSGLAILLGVAMIAGAFVETDAINRAFGNIENTAYRGVAAAVTPRTAFHSQFAEPNPFSSNIVARIAALPGVARSEGQLSEIGQLVVRGKHVNNTGAPSLVISMVGSRSTRSKRSRGGCPMGRGR